MTQITEKQVMHALSHVIEPELHKDLVTLDMITNVEISENDVAFTVVLTTPACPLKNEIQNACETALRRHIPEIGNITVNWGAEVQKNSSLTDRLDIDVRNIIAVVAGKGGVGKSTIATNLAISLSLEGANVGLMDADIYGPNIPLMMGVNERPLSENDKIKPLIGHGIKLMSVGFLVEKEQPIIWRGPIIHTAIRQFLSDVDWDDLDYLVVDLPPGTGDASLSLAQSISLSGAVIVTTPQQVAISDVIRSAGMFHKLNVPILGVIENMSYFIAPDTGKRYNIFGEGGGKAMAKETGIPFLGEVPLESVVRECGDEGVPVVIRHPESPAAKALREIAKSVAAKISVQNV
ncbi:MAG: hypothetical protein B6242_06555 [Anaerolineaceae bacterium 4572_78]|nr:MAG: hypothetical protein B6242_06555 [Anaerolineaceae bacterium 4572_78]